MTDPTSTYLALLKFLSQLADAAKAGTAEDRAAIEEFTQLAELADECDADGNLTRRASEARRKLANPSMASTPMNRAVGARRAKMLKSSKRAIDLFMKAAEALGLALQDSIAFKTYDEAKPLEGNRKARDTGHEVNEDIQHFLNWMDEERLPPYVFGRLKIAEKGFIARLIRDAREDPYYERKDNVWTLLFGAGMLEAPQSAPTDDQRKAMAMAWSRYYGSSDSLRKDLEARLGRPLDVSESFAASMEVIAKRDDALGDEEWRLLFCAANEQISEDAEIIGRILGYDMQGKQRIEAAITSINNTARLARNYENDAFAIAVASLVAGIDECATRQYPIEEWPQLILNGYFKEISSVTKFGHDPKQFWALFALAMKLSGLDRKYPYRETADRSIVDQIEEDVPLYPFNGFDRAWEVSSYVADSSDAAEAGPLIETSANLSAAYVSDIAPPDDAVADAAVELPLSAEISSPSNSLVIWQGVHVDAPDIASSAGQHSLSFDDPQTQSQPIRPIRQEDLE